MLKAFCQKHNPIRVSLPHSSIFTMPCHMKGVIADVPILASKYPSSVNLSLLMCGPRYFQVAVSDGLIQIFQVWSLGTDDCSMLK